MKKVKKIKVVIPYELPTWNEAISLAKMMNKGKAYAGMKRRFTNKLAVLLKSKLPDIVFDRVSLVIRWGMRDRRKDPDNVASGVKFILDGMVVAGIIEGDGWKYVRKIIHLFLIKDRTEIELTIIGELK